MTSTNEKKFVITHTFDDPIYLKEGENMEGPIEFHFGVPWRIRIAKTNNKTHGILECPVASKFTDWSIEAKFTGFLLVKEVKTTYGSYTKKFHPDETTNYYFLFDQINTANFLIDGKLPVEFHIEIIEVTGDCEKKKLRSFDDETAKKFSDVVLTIGDRKFYVYKGYLASHSTYFEALLLGNFAESQKSEIELKEINPEDFQNFLEFLHAESSIEADTVLGILQLADFFDSKTVIRRCQQFLIYKSELSLKQKFETAVKYNLEELKTMCLSEIKTSADLQSISPEKGVQYGEAVMLELFNKAMSFLPK